MSNSISNNMLIWFCKNCKIRTLLLNFFYRNIYIKAFNT